MSLRGQTAEDDVEWREGQVEDASTPTMLCSEDSQLKSIPARPQQRTQSVTGEGGSGRDGLGVWDQQRNTNKMDKKQGPPVEQRTIFNIL